MGAVFFAAMPDAAHLIEALHSELAFEFVRSSGPGGQNVNKVATTVQLRFNIGRSAALSEAAKTRLIRLAGSRVTGDGILLIDARRHRTQDRNRTDAIARFDDLVRRALKPPTRRVPTKATAASRVKRLESKKRRGEIKKARQSRSHEA